MPHELSAAKYRTVSGYVVSTTASLDTGDVMVELREDNGTS